MGIAFLRFYFEEKMRILHISPSSFGDHSVVGGGERYPLELARHMAEAAETVLVSFGAPKQTLKNGQLTVEYLPNLVSSEFLKRLFWADVIHCHQLFRFETDAGILAAVFRGKKVFASDLGGFGRRSISARLPLQKKLNGLLLISQFSEEVLRRNHPELAGVPSSVIMGGVDFEKFSPGPAAVKSNSFLFVGRILPHKGIDYLIDALDENTELDVAGRIYDRKYYEILLEKSRGKKVRFHHGLNDQELIAMYRGSSAVVQPSVYETCFGHKTEVPELLGLAALEGMSCGIPAIVSSAGSLPELVREGLDGFIVPPNDSAALREKMNYLAKNPEASRKMGAAARGRVLSHFTWKETVARCLKAYEGAKP